EPGFGISHQSQQRRVDGACPSAIYRHPTCVCGNSPRRTLPIRGKHWIRLDLRLQNHREVRCAGSTCTRHDGGAAVGDCTEMISTTLSYRSYSGGGEDDFFIRFSGACGETTRRK